MAVGKQTAACGIVVLALGAALLACKKGDEAAPTGGASTAAPVAEVPTGAAPTAAATPTAPPPPEENLDDGQPIPKMPSKKSNPPVGAEWDRGKKVNTQAANSQPDGCSLTVLREWLRVYCDGKIVGYEKMENFGVKTSDYFEQVVPGKYASFVLRLKKGKTQAIRICREGSRASLFVSWPSGAERPKHVALGKGPECDGSDWGAFQKKGGATAGGGAQQGGGLGEPCSKACPHGLAVYSSDPTKCEPCAAGYSCMRWGADPMMDDPGSPACVCEKLGCDITQ
ncbi:MAG: hypothetical protein IT376_03035 [Polyangiaceae bacterium]|nr:hypothetical protein [Polyangiaceae bacterium]